MMTYLQRRFAFLAFSQVENTNFFVFPPISLLFDLGPDWKLTVALAKKLLSYTDFSQNIDEHS